MNYGPSDRLSDFLIEFLEILGQDGNEMSKNIPTESRFQSVPDPNRMTDGIRPFFAFLAAKCKNARDAQAHLLINESQRPDSNLLLMQKAFCLTPKGGAESDAKCFLRGYCTMDSASYIAPILSF